MEVLALDIKIHSQAKRSTTLHGRWVGNIVTPWTCDDRVLGTCAGDDLAVLGDVGEEVLAAVAVAGVVEDEGVGTDTALGPVPVSD